MTIGDGNSDVLCCKFNHDDRYLAVGYGDGMLRIYNNTNGKLSYTLSSLSEEDDQPITNVLWRPITSTFKTANVLVTCSSDGSLKHWHASSGKLLHSRQDDPNNHLYAMDFTPDGTLLAVAGKDMHIYVYDENTKSLALKMKESGPNPGHSNRIFCTKFNPADPNMLVSGGWDNTI
jgi:COMPASS component SWD3